MMKMRAFFLIVLMIAGTYAMIQSFQEYEEKAFTELLNPMNEPINSLIFSRPSPTGSGAETWIVSESNEIEALLNFLEDVQINELTSDEFHPSDEINHFSISLKDAEDNIIRIIINETLMIEHASVYYEIVDHPLDIDWLVQFFIHNQGK